MEITAREVIEKFDQNAFAVAEWAEDLLDSPAILVNDPDRLLEVLLLSDSKDYDLLAWCHDAIKQCPDYSPNEVKSVIAAFKKRRFLGKWLALFK